MKQFDFASPSQFSDWAQYAGFNRNTGEVEGNQNTQQAIKPPENFGDYMNQRMGSAEGMANAVVPAMAQLGQGNVMGAVNTVRQARNPAQQTTTSPIQQIAPISGYDYTHGIEEE